MLQFSVKFPASRPSPVGKEFYHFGVEGSTVMLAGSRHKELEPLFCVHLVTALASLEADFLTGCSKGTDACFRSALTKLDYKDRVFVGLAFNSKTEKIDLPCKKVVANGLKPAVALAKRTVWLCGEADMLILFPSEPIGPGSALAFKTMIQSNKPVFLAGETEPESSPDYEVYPSRLLDMVHGYWVLPHVYKDEPEQFFFM